MLAASTICLQNPAEFIAAAAVDYLDSYLYLNVYFFMNWPELER
jgi:hypothetical protein